MSEFKKVDKETYLNFLADYPKELIVDITGICEPPLKTWNDFSNGKVWPESIVAKVVLNESMKGHPCYQGESNDYYVLEIKVCE